MFWVAWRGKISQNRILYLRSQNTKETRVFLMASADLNFASLLYLFYRALKFIPLQNLKSNIFFLFSPERYYAFWFFLGISLLWKRKLGWLVVFFVISMPLLSELTCPFLDSILFFRKWRKPSISGITVPLCTKSSRANTSGIYHHLHKKSHTTSCGDVWKSVRVEKRGHTAR